MERKNGIGCFYPTDLFRISEPQNPSFDEVYEFWHVVRQIFEHLKCEWVGRVACTVLCGILLETKNIEEKTKKNGRARKIYVRSLCCLINSLSTKRNYWLFWVLAWKRELKREEEERKKKKETQAMSYHVGPQKVPYTSRFFFSSGLLVWRCDVYSRQIICIRFLSGHSFQTPENIGPCACP